MKIKINKSKSQITQKSIVEKFDTGTDCLTLPRYQEFDVPELPKIGKKYLVWKQENVGPNSTHSGGALGWSDAPEMLSDGFPGNSDSNIRRFHGWRGTTNDIYVDALGVRECEEIIRTEYEKTVHYKIVFGQDLVEDEE